MLKAPEIVELGGQKYKYEDGVYTRRELVELLLQKLRGHEDLKNSIECLKADIKDLNSQLKALEVDCGKLQRLVFTIDEGLAEDLAVYSETVKE